MRTLRRSALSNGSATVVGTTYSFTATTVTASGRTAEPTKTGTVRC